MNNEYKLTEQEIDDIVISQVNDDDAWEEPINVTVADPAIVSLPPKLVARAAFFAQLHNKATAAEWLQQIIQERINFEEAAFADLKRVMEKRPDYTT